MRIARDESGSVLKIAGTLEIGIADELQRVLCSYVDGAAAPVVDVGEVDGCDTAALQLLVAAQRSAEQAAKPFKLIGAPAAIGDLCAILGLSFPAGGVEDAT